MLFAAIIALAVLYVFNYIEHKETWNASIGCYGASIVAIYIFPSIPDFIKGIVLIGGPIAMLVIEVYALKAGHQAYKESMTEWFKTEVEPELAKLNPPAEAPPKKVDISDAERRIEELLKQNRR